MTNTVFYVLNGLLNGEEGVYAQRSGTGTTLADGHYFLPEDASDGIGPFQSRDAAERAAKKHEPVQYWSFPLGGGDPRRVPVMDQFEGDDNVAKITRSEDPNTFTAELVGSYDVLTLTMTAPSHEAVADVYRHLLVVSAKYQ